MSGGLPRIGLTNSTATIKHNGASTEPGLAEAELVRRKRAEMGPGPVDPQTGRPLGQPSDIADLALRDAESGKVRKVRAGSTRDSILGQSMNTATMDPNYWASRVMNGGKR